MEGVAPLFKSLNDVEYSLMSGRTVLNGIESYIRRNENDWSQFLKEWVSYRKNDRVTEELERKLKSPYRRTALLLFSTGMKGQSVLKELRLLKEEVQNESELEIEEFLRLLPYKMMVPVLVFMFPALMMTLLGPILESLLGAL